MFRILAIAALALLGAALAAPIAGDAVARPRAGPGHEIAAAGPWSSVRPDVALEPAQSRRRYRGRRNWSQRRIGRDRRFGRPRGFSPRGYRYNRRGSRGGVLPMRVVAARALACHPGRILDARLQGSTYVFKILTRRGRVVRVYGDARSGSVSCR